MRLRTPAFAATSILLVACSKPEAQKDLAPVPAASPNASAATPTATAPTVSAASPNASATTTASAALQAERASADPKAGDVPSTTAGATATAPAPTAAATASGASGASGTKVVTTTTTTTGPLQCGTKPLPDCPMQAWMKANTALALSSNDMPALASAYDKITKMAPPVYTNWVSVSKDGAAAAKAGNVDAAKAACRSCHEQYKAKYKAEMRARPLP